MRINIFFTPLGLTSADIAGKPVIVIDILRATTTIITALANGARTELQNVEPGHPWLQGDWPDYPSRLRRLNPFAGEKSALDNDERD